MSSLQISYRKALESDAWSMVGVHYDAVQAVGPEHYSNEVVFAWSPPLDVRCLKNPAL